MPLKSAALFDALAAGVKEQGSTLVKKVNGVIQFNIKPDGVWTVDLKNGAGSVTNAAAPKADLQINVSDDDFVALSQQKLNPQQAFMQGKIKIKGNMGLAMKLQTVMNAARSANPELAKKAAAAASGAGGAGGSKLKSAPIFEQIGEAVKTQGADLVKKVKGVIRFSVDGEQFTIDLKNGNGAFRKGGEGKADLTVTVSDDNFIALQAGKLNAQQAFMQGKIKIKGNMGLAMKLQTVMNAAKPKSKL